VTGQRVAGSGDTEFRYQFTGAASVTKIGFAQRIEATNSYDLNGSTATLSVDLANSLLTTVTWTIRYANTTDTFGTLASPTRTQIATGTFTVNSTVTRYSTQITIPSAATTGIEIEFSVGAQTSGTWTIGNVQLERGSAATPFEVRPIGIELPLCQRYCQRLGNNFSGQSNGTTAILLSGSLPVELRTNPTFTLLTTSWSAPSQYFVFVGNTWRDNASAGISSQFSNGPFFNSISFQLTGFSGLTGGQPATLNFLTNFLLLSAEL
jgi:hypothetical protein